MDILSNPLDSEDFISSVKSENFFHIKFDDPNISMFEWVKFIVTSDDMKKRWLDDRSLGYFTRLEGSPDLFDYIKNIKLNLEEMFPENRITIHSFFGWDDNSKSFSIHRDASDVFYVQLIGETGWRMLEPKDSAQAKYEDCVNLEEDEVNCLFNKTFTPGDAIWVPKGFWHHASPIGNRVGLSFGVEGKLKGSESILG